MACMKRPSTRALRKLVIAQCRHNTSGPEIARSRRRGFKIEEEDTDKHFTFSSDGARSVRQRVNGRKSLPVPPFLDPVVDSARRRHECMRELPQWDNLSPFQREVIDNPYVSILSTPLRKDVLSDSLLPTHFLQRFKTEFRLPPPSQPKDRKQAIPSSSPSSPSTGPQPPSQPTWAPRPKPHLIPEPPTPPNHHPAKPTPTPNPSTYSHASRLSLLALTPSRRSRLLVSQRHERVFGVDSATFVFDASETVERVQDGRGRYAVRGLQMLKARGQLWGVTEAGTEARKGRVAVVVVDPSRVGIENFEAWKGRIIDELKGKGQVLLPEFLFVLPPLVGGKQDLSEMGDVVVFKIEAGTMGKVASLLRLDMFYAARLGSNGKEEILDLWRKETEQHDIP